MSSISESINENRKEIYEFYNGTGYVLLTDVFKIHQELLKESKGASYKLTNYPAERIIHEATPTEQLREAAQELAQLIEKKIGKITLLKLEAGNYTLQHNTQPKGDADLVIFFTTHWTPENRGELVYTTDDGDALIIAPKHNSACLVTRNPDTRSFWKRVTYHAGKDTLYALHAELK